MRTSWGVLAASVLAGASAFVLGAAPPALAEASGYPAAALESSVSETETETETETAAPRAIWVHSFSYSMTPAVGQPLTITVAMSSTVPPAGDNPYTSLPEGLEFTVTRTDLASPSGASLGTLTTDARGFVVLNDTPQVGGPLRYTFSYAGSAELAGISFSTSYEIPRNATSLRLDKHNTVNAYGSTVTLTATLGSTHSNRVVEIWARPYGQAERLVRKAAVDSTGKVTTAVKLTRNTWVTARYAGDARFAPATQQVNLWTRVGIDTKLGRHYRTAKIGSTTYRYFRKSVKPLVTHTVTPWRGRKVRTVIEAYRGGKWELWSGRITKIDAEGKTSFTFRPAPKAGQRFRVRAEFTADERDTANYRTIGAWTYFIFTK
jgi:hypothetical protein